MLKRMSANISFALDNFALEAARKESERAVRRLNLMFGAISATNEAILRAKTEQDLYQRVCEAATQSGKSIATVVLLAEKGSTWLKSVAGTGESVELIAHAQILDRSRQHLRQRRLRQGVPHQEALRQPRYRQFRAGAAMVAGGPRDRCRGLRRGASDQVGQERRRADVLCRQVLGGGRRKSSRCWRGWRRTSRSRWRISIARRRRRRPTSRRSAWRACSRR